MKDVLMKLLVGLGVGFVARILMPGPGPEGWIRTLVLGMAGAWIGSEIGQRLGWYPAGGKASFGMSVAGALLLLIAIRLFV